MIWLTATLARTVLVGSIMLLVMCLAILVVDPTSLSVNYAATTLMRASLATGDWSSAEAAWLAAAAGLRPDDDRLIDGLDNTYRHWYNSNREQAEFAIRSLSRRLTTTGASTTLLLVGDRFRGRASRKAALLFYQKAIEASRWSELSGLERAEWLSSEPRELVLDGDEPLRSLKWRRTEGETVALSQRVPIWGSGLYKLSLEGRGFGSIEFQVSPTNTTPWRHGGSISPRDAWTSRELTFWVPDHGTESLELRITHSTRSEVRYVRLSLLDEPRNRLRNSGFVVPDGRVDFVPWSAATFWNEQSAVGKIESMNATEKDRGVRIILTSAAKSGDRIGLQQECGEVPPHSVVELSASLSIARPLESTFASVEAILYRKDAPEQYLTVNTLARDPMPFQDIRHASIRIPPGGSSYSCIVVVQVFAVVPHRDGFDVVELSDISLTVTPS